jgi:hypothetical protein
LKLLIEHLTVGNNDDAIEDKMVVLSEEIGQLMPSQAIVFDFPEPALC